MRTLLTFFLLMTSLMLEAKYDVTPKCYKELETKFFDPDIVQVALSLYDVNQGSWGSINLDIEQETAGIHERLWAEGRTYRFNPLDNKYQPDLAAELLRRELFAIFHKACQKNFVTSEANIKAMFEYIEQRQAAKIHACFGRDTFIPKKEDTE